MQAEQMKIRNGTEMKTVQQLFDKKNLTLKAKSAKEKLKTTLYKFLYIYSSGKLNASFALSFLKEKRQC